MIKRMLLAWSIAVCMMTGVSAAEEAFRQTYPLNPDKVSSNERKVAADLKTLPGVWQNAPLLYYTVPAMSDVPRLPDAYPDDGTATGPLQLVAAKGEFEPGSIVVYPRRNADAFTLKCGILKNSAGDTLPTSALDVKLVKVWYQAGSAWCGFFADSQGRVLTPELLLNDEALVRVDPKTKDNYVRYSNQDGTESWQWMSANFSVVGYSHANQANTGLIADSPELRPVVLNKNEFKQFFVTAHISKDAKAGIYTGGIDLIADGKNVGTVPVSIRVLPFELPKPKTNYDRAKNFYLCLYGTESENPLILKDLADHNATPMGFFQLNVFMSEFTKRRHELGKQAGIDDSVNFSGATSSGLVTSQPPVGSEIQKLKNLKRIIGKSTELSQKEFGHTNFFSYGVDEGGPDVIRGQRNAWKITHDAGGKIMVTSYPWRQLLFALDYLIIPRAPAPNRVTEVNLFHESNPDALTGWYADPHSGPENPDAFRRFHGFQAYKSNYDVSSNYCWWRNNWNDMATPYEPNLRGLVMVYAGRDKVIDTIAWEGVREGLDDVKYASYLKDLALEALKSKNSDVQLLGRRALSFLAYTDETRADLNAFRLECTNFILRLRTALNKGN